MAALEEIVTPNGTRTNDDWVKNNIVSLLGALYMYIWRSVSMPPEGFNEAKYVQVRKRVVETLRQARVSKLEFNRRFRWSGCLGMVA